MEQSTLHGKRFPTRPDWVETRLEYDASLHQPQVSAATLADLRSRWNASLARYRELARAETNPTQRLTAVMRALVRDYLSTLMTSASVPADSSQLIEAIAGRGATAVARVEIIQDVLAQIPELVPPGYVPAVQANSSAVLPVLVPTDSSDHRVWNVLTNTIIGERDLDVYQPAFITHGFVSAHGGSVSGTSTNLLMYQAHH